MNGLRSDVKVTDVGARNRPPEQRIDVEEIQRELQGASKIHVRVVRKRCFYR